MRLAHTLLAGSSLTTGCKYCGPCRALNVGLMSTVISLQDTTNTPAWTGETKSVIGEDSRAAQFLRKFDSLRQPEPQQK